MYGSLLDVLPPWGLSPALDAGTMASQACSLGPGTPAWAGQLLTGPRVLNGL